MPLHNETPVVPGVYFR